MYVAVTEPCKQVCELEVLQCFDDPRNDMAVLQNYPVTKELFYGVMQCYQIYLMYFVIKRCYRPVH